ncbi:MAG: hypothetical protein SNJ77_03010 [Cytophagales bacterium]
MAKSKTKETPIWQPTPENKKKATNFRIISIVLWVLAIGFEVFLIYKFWFEKSWKFEISFPVIAGFAVILILAVVGNLLWRQSNKLDPASEKEPIRFFIQNQLGAIISVLAFLPLLIFILKDKNIDGKTKAVLGGIVGVFMIIAVGTGIETNPASIEKYAAETNMVEALTGANVVFWTEHGGKYHLNEECHSIKNRASIYNGPVADAKASKGITDLCGHCKNKVMKEKGLNEDDLGAKIKEIEVAKEKALENAEM